MPDTGPIYIIEPSSRRDAVNAVSLWVEYQDAEELVRQCQDMLAAGAAVVEPQQVVRRGMPVTLVLTFPGLLRPIHINGHVTAVDVPPKGSSDRGTRARVELGEHLDETAIDAISAHFEPILAHDPHYVVRVVRVLVVEDNPHCARLIQEGLRLAGKRAFGNRLAFDVPMASNAADAFTYLHTQAIDVLITDIYLGGINGTTVIEHVRANSALRHMPVIAISAGDEATRVASLEAGADVFLPKPVRLREIVGTVGKVLQLDQIAWR